MLKIVLCPLFVVFSHFAFSQQFAYSFSGHLSSGELEKLKLEILNLPDVKSCEIRYKEQAEVGEALFYIFQPTERTEASTLFSPVMVKELYTNLGLVPSEFRLIKD